MRFLHLADLHIGKIVNAYNMIEDQEYLLKQVVELIKEERVHAVLLAGDIYDKTQPSEDAVNLFDWFLNQVSETNAHIIAIPGNHDSAERLAFAQSFLKKQGVHFPPSFSGEMERVVLEDEHGPVNFWLLPYLRPIDARRAFPDAEIGSDYTKAVKTVLDAAQINTKERNVLLSHQFVTAFGYKPERANEEISLGGVDNVDVSAYDSFDYVALGHVHRPQRIGRDTVRYAGSLLKYNISEARFPKSVTLVDVGPKADNEKLGSCITFEQISLTPLHEMRQIKGPLAQLLDEQVVSAGAPHDFLHVTLTDETPQIDALNRLRETYPNILALDYDNATTRSNTNLNTSSQTLEDIDPVRVFSEFFSAQAGHELNDEQAQLASKLLYQSAEEVKGGTR